MQGRAIPNQSARLALDVLTGAIATPSVGVRGGLKAAFVPVPFVAAGLWALRGDPKATGRREPVSGVLAVPDARARSLEHR